jgi:hypothetical protein
LRWGIADVEGWLSTIDPAVIDRWLVFATVEPAAFGGRAAPPGGEVRAEPSGGTVSARQAAKNMAQRFG